jgi:hypothetical protein
MSHGRLFLEASILSSFVMGGCWLYQFSSSLDASKLPALIA